MVSRESGAGVCISRWMDPTLPVFRWAMDACRCMSGLEGRPMMPSGVPRRLKLGDWSGFRPRTGSSQSGSGVSSRRKRVRWEEVALWSRFRRRPWEDCVLSSR